MDSSLRLGRGPMREEGAWDGKSLMEGCPGDDKGHPTNRSLQQVLVRLGSAGVHEAPLSSRSSQAQEHVSPVPAAGFRPHVSAPTQLPSRPQPVQVRCWALDVSTFSWVITCLYQPRCVPLSVPWLQRSSSQHALLHPTYSSRFSSDTAISTSSPLTPDDNVVSL